MNCDQLMEHLPDFLGGDLVVEHRETLVLHLAGCPRCGAYVASYTHTIRIARVLPKGDALPPAFEARLRKVIEPELKANKSE